MCKISAMKPHSSARKTAPPTDFTWRIESEHVLRLWLLFFAINSTTDSVYANPPNPTLVKFVAAWNITSWPLTEYPGNWNVTSCSIDWCVRQYMDVSVVRTCHALTMCHNFFPPISRCSLAADHTDPVNCS